MYDWECDGCGWIERCEGNPFGLDRPRCPWDWCMYYRLLMAVYAHPREKNIIRGICG